MIHRSESLDIGTGKITVVEYDTTAQTVTTTVGTDEPVTRPMTPEEIQYYDGLDQMQINAANTNEMVAESDTSVDKLIAVINALNAITDMTNASINANPAAVIKSLTRECKTIARQVNREARMTSGRTEDTDTGPVTDV